MTKEEIYLDKKRQSLIERARPFSGKMFCGVLFEIKTDNLGVLDTEKTFSTPDICSFCGSCCCTFPCLFAPSDFLDLNDMQYMRSILDIGLLCISRLQNSFTYIIRARGGGDLWIGSTLDDIKYNFDGDNPCKLFRSGGCALSIDYRPSEGVLRYALGGGLGHINMYSNSDISREYRKYQESLSNLFLEYCGVNKPAIVTEENVRKLTRCLAGYKR